MFVVKRVPREANSHPAASKHWIVAGLNGREEDDAIVVVCVRRLGDNGIAPWPLITWRWDGSLDDGLRWYWYGRAGVGVLMR